jgi:energy-converting hydrogenase B subunit D
MLGVAMFDVLLAVVLPLLAWWAIVGPDLFRSVVLFIVFGLLLALVWVRLQAPDVALAEAAIGAGITGALLLDTLGRIGTEDSVINDAKRSHDEITPSGEHPS